MERYPEIRLPSATEIVGPKESGYGVYGVRLSEVTREDFFSYKDYLLECGYNEMSSCITVSSVPLDVSVFKNGNRFVALRHAPGRRTWIGFYEDPDYHDWSAKEVFDEVPETDGGYAEHVGQGIYMVCKESVSENEHLKYVKMLEENGFMKYVQHVIAGMVTNSIYTKGRVVLSVIYLKKSKKMFIEAGFDTPLSSHLEPVKYSEEKNKKEATTLAMLQMKRLGSSFIFQLKNGHYIVNDGGLGSELEELLTYLEINAPVGEKPIVEAWVISHAHNDHSAVLVMMAENPEYAKRLQIDGIYFNEPSELKRALEPSEANYQILGMKDASKLFRAPIYRLQTGQRYYFCDLTMDILLASEQVPMCVHSNDFNDTSTWCLYTVEGQTCMIAGDADRGCCHVFSEIYEKGYWKFDVFTAFHHGSNTSDVVTEYCDFQTVLVSRAEQPKKHPEENANLKAKSKEWFIKGEGSRVLTFPYKVGESIILKEFDLKYEL